MTGKERIESMFRGEPCDSLPFMPITMMFAAHRAGVAYGRYATDYCVLVEAQCRIVDEFDIDHVSCISDPAREAADCGATVHYFDDQPPAIDETKARLADKGALLNLRAPDPFGGGRMHVERIDVAGLDGHRLVVVTKVRRTPDRYPRDPSVRARERRASPVS